MLGNDIENINTVLYLGSERIKNVKRHSLKLLLLFAISTCFSISLCAQTPAPTLGKAADNKIYAQSLVGPIMDADPDLSMVGIHAAPPGSKEHHMIACSADRIGKADDEEDGLVIDEQELIVAPSIKQSKIVVLVPLRDRNGGQVGGLVLVFKYHQGDDGVRFLSRTLAIADNLSKKIPDHDSLFRPLGN